MKPLSAKAVSEVYGFTARHWIRLAAAGKIPGAWQPSGVGGKWMFDGQIFARWRKDSNRKVSAWPGFTGEAKPIGRGLKGMVESSETPLRQEIDKWLSAGLSNGKNASKGSPGATVHVLHSPRR